MYCKRRSAALFLEFITPEYRVPVTWSASDDLTPFWSPWATDEIRWHIAKLRHKSHALAAILAFELWSSPGLQISVLYDFRYRQLRRNVDALLARAGEAKTFVEVLKEHRWLW